MTAETSSVGGADGTKSAEITGALSKRNCCSVIRLYMVYYGYTLNILVFFNCVLIRVVFKTYFLLLSFILRKTHFPNTLLQSTFILWMNVAISILCMYFHIHIYVWHNPFYIFYVCNIHFYECSHIYFLSCEGTVTSAVA